MDDFDRIEILNKNLNKTVKDLKSQVAAQENKALQLSTQLCEAQNENAKLQQALEELEDELTPEMYANPLLQFEERNHLEGVISKYKRDYDEVREELRVLKNARTKDVSSLKVKVQVLEKENAKLLAMLNSTAKEEKVKLDQKAIEREFALEQELTDLCQKNIAYEQEVSHLKLKLDKYIDMEAKLSADRDAEIKNCMHLQAEINVLKMELDDARAELTEQRKLQMEMSSKDIDLLNELEKFRSTDELTKQPSSITLNNMNIKDEFHKTLLEKRELEEEAEKYRSQVRRLSSQFDVIQQRESELNKQLKELRKLLMDTKKSEIEIANCYTKEKVISEQKQRLLADLEIKHQLLSSKLARSQQELGHEMENSKNLRLSQTEMSRYIDRLVAAVIEHCPDLLEKV